MVGFILAFAESLSVLIDAGPFLADSRFFVKALALNGLAGSFLGGLFAPLAFVLDRFFFKRPKNAVAVCFSFYLAGGVFFEILFYLLDTYTYGGRNKGSWRTIGIAFITAALLSGLAILLRFWIANPPARKWPSLMSPGLNLRKIAVVLGLVTSLGFSFWLSGQISISGEKRLIRAKRSALRGPAPSLIFLVVDSLRADHMSFNGYPLQTSPFMDLLAANGAVFPATVASSSWTLPTHASLFTGLYPSSHGAYSVFLPLGTEYPTLAEILARKGYYTLSIYANPLLGSATGLDRGFDRALGVGNRQKTSLTLARIFNKIVERSSSVREVLALSLRWIDHSRKLNVPYAIFMNVLEAHAPYKPKQPYFEEFCQGLPLKDVRWPLLRRALSPRGSRQEKQSALTSLAELDLAVLSRLYDSNLRFIDQKIRAWAEQLKDFGEFDQSLLVMTSDHGEFLGEHNQLEHRTDRLYNPVIQTPLIFHFPKKLPARLETQFISQVDIFPTILSLLGLGDQIPPGIHGANLFSKKAGEPVIAEFWDERARSFTRAFYVENLKLIRKGDESVELYDLQKDPQEKLNLVRSRPGEVTRLVGELERFLSFLKPHEARPDPERRKILERLLKSFGYIK